MRGYSTHDSCIFMRKGRFMQTARTADGTATNVRDVGRVLGHADRMLDMFEPVATALGTRIDPGTCILGAPVQSPRWLTMNAASTRP